MTHASATFPECQRRSNLRAATVCPFQRFLRLRRRSRARFAESLPAPGFRRPGAAGQDHEII